MASQPGGGDQRLVAGVSGGGTWRVVVEWRAHK